jgi:hypothetical protein
MWLVGFMMWSFGLDSHVIISSHRWHIQQDFFNVMSHFDVVVPCGRFVCVQ